MCFKSQDKGCVGAIKKLVKSGWTHLKNIFRKSTAATKPGSDDDRSIIETATDFQNNEAISPLPSTAPVSPTAQDNHKAQDNRATPQRSALQRKVQLWLEHARRSEATLQRRALQLERARRAKANLQRRALQQTVMLW